jgi:tetratricopeptide (TPR) repeat protein
MSVGSQGVDPKTAQRLRARRIIVVDAASSRAQAFAEALQQSGAAVAMITPSDKDYQAAHALDADVLLVNEDEPEPCRALVLALRQHPRTRWSTVLPVSFAALWPSESEEPDVATIADQVTGFATALVELTVRAKGKLPYEAPLEPLGPSRTLRALATTGRSLRITLEDGRMRAELELDEGRLAGARAWLDKVQTPLEDAEALSDVLAMSAGRLRIEERGELALASWNVELTVALAKAAEITREREHHATVPQLSFADILAEARAKGRDLGYVPPTERVTIPNAAPVDDAAPAPAVPIVERRNRSAAPPRMRARTLAMAFALLGTSALAVALHTRTDARHVAGTRSARAAASYTASLATAVPRPELQPAPTQTVIEPATAPQEAAPEVREPTRSELAQAKRIIKRANHYLRAKRYATAAAAFTKALALAPSHGHAMRALVRIHLRERNADDALHWAEQLAALEPDDSTSQRLLGDAHALSGDTARAAQAWQRSSALGSDAASKRTRPK